MKFICHNREYSSWSFEDKTIENSEIDLCPIEKKLLTGDIIDDNGVIYSPYRSKKSVAGILNLSASTFGRANSGKFYYKCYPDDIGLPVFLIPYLYKPDFSKKVINKYITFKFNHWDEKHPYGSIVSVVGDVDDDKSFYEYQVIRKDLPTAPGVKSLKQIMKAMSSRTIDSIIHDIHHNKLYNIRDSDDVNIFTIDPSGCKDMDDALSIESYDRGYKVSVFIANVPLLLETLDLWDIVDGKYASIYLPNRIIPMLNSILSANLCSLVKGKERPTFVMEVYILDEKVINIEFKNSVVFIRENYEYDQKELLENIDYKNLFDITKIINKNNNYLEKIDDSHDIVAFYMIFMNHMIAKYLVDHSRGIFRTSTQNKRSVDEKPFSQEVHQFLENWNGSGAKYVDSTGSCGHYSIGKSIDHYLHATSPIRRQVDIVNLIEIQKLMGVIYGINSNNFVSSVYQGLDKLNEVMKNISRVQSDCSLYQEFMVNKLHKDTIYDGVIIEIEEKTRGHTDVYRYTVYLSTLKVVFSVVLSGILDLYSIHKFSLHVFHDETTLRKKVRMNLV